MGKLKILLVDDEPDILEVMGGRIEKWGHKVIKAASGQAGLDMIRKKRPDIVILDYMMPDMDGVATLQEIRKIDKKLRIIMFTAYPDQYSFKWSKKLDVSAFIPKLSAYSDTHSALKAAIDMIEKKK